MMSQSVQFFLLEELELALKKELSVVRAKAAGGSVTVNEGMAELVESRVRTIPSSRGPGSASVPTVPPSEARGLLPN